MHRPALRVDHEHLTPVPLFNRPLTTSHSPSPRHEKEVGVEKQLLSVHDSAWTLRSVDARHTTHFLLSLSCPPSPPPTLSLPQTRPRNEPAPEVSVEELAVYHSGWTLRGVDARHASVVRGGQTLAQCKTPRHVRVYY